MVCIALGDPISHNFSKEFLNISRLSPGSDVRFLLLQRLIQVLKSFFRRSSVERLAIVSTPAIFQKGAVLDLSTTVEM